MLEMILRVAVCCSVGFAASALAADFCVSTSAGLTTALADADVNDQDNVIRLRTGVYIAPTNGWAIDLGNGEHSLDVIGGYQDAGCLTRTADAEATVLDGEDRTRILTIDVGCNFVQQTVERVLVSGLTFERGFDNEVGALKISDPGPISCGLITVEGNIFRDNHITDGSFGVAPALLAATDGLDFDGAIWLMVRNNLFEGNVSPNAPAAFLFSNNRIVFDNNTVVRNIATDALADERVILETFVISGLTLANNIFWSNQVDSVDSFDLRTNNVSDLVSNTIEAKVGPTATDVGSSMANPQFADELAGDFRLAPASPAIDTGTALAALPPSNFDVAGGARVVGTGVDRGAYEFADAIPDAIFADGFEE